jgi:FKBP-type peptidyl-prolyl cis-trans isomerase SlyD
MMKIEKDSVVSIDYTLTDEKGEVLDSSKDHGHPLLYLHGAGNIIPGLENSLTGKSTGERFTITVSPEDGYGVRDERAVARVNRDQFKGVEDLEVGMQFRTEGSGSSQVVTVTAIEQSTVTVDGNHPLAGKTLHFDVAVVSVRKATPEELSHGHVHGPGGHH